MVKFPEDGDIGRPPCLAGVGEVGRAACLKEGVGERGREELYLRGVL